MQEIRHATVPPLKLAAPASGKGGSVVRLAGGRAPVEIGGRAFVVLAGPSHAAGRPELILPLSLAAAAAGADGILLETHPHPENALCDGAQALRPEDLRDLVERLGPVVEAVGRTSSKPAQPARRATLR